jgi:transcriptional regulator with XRE-family HTH domain
LAARSALCVHAGLTQAALAEKAGLAVETISRIESGREPPALRTAMSLADALDASVDQVVGRRGAAVGVAREDDTSPELTRLIVAPTRPVARRGSRPY